MAAAHVGHPAARLEARLHAVERGDPLADQVHRVAGTEEALASLVHPGVVLVVLVPADADAGAPKGLRCPASLVRVGKPWASEVLVHTISRINAHLPPVPALP